MSSALITRAGAKKGGGGGGAKKSGGGGGSGKGGGKKDERDTDKDEDEDDDADSYVAAMVCAGCEEGDDEQKIILCDSCDAGYHIYCLRPKLTQIPRGNWFCPVCVAKEAGPNSLFSHYVYAPHLVHFIVHLRYPTLILASVNP